MHWRWALGKEGRKREERREEGRSRREEGEAINCFIPTKGPS